MCDVTNLYIAWRQHRCDVAARHSWSGWSWRWLPTGARWQEARVGLKVNNVVEAYMSITSIDYIARMWRTRVARARKRASTYVQPAWHTRHAQKKKTYLYLWCVCSQFDVRKRSQKYVGLTSHTCNPISWPYLPDKIWSQFQYFIFVQSKNENIPKQFQ